MLRPGQCADISLASRERIARYQTGGLCEVKQSNREVRLNIYKNVILSLKNNNHVSTKKIMCLLLVI